MLCLWCVVLTGMALYAQEDSYLRQLTSDLVKLRGSEKHEEALNKTVISWSATGSPKITLMDEIKRDKEHEYSKPGAKKFKMNQLVTYVYQRQNIGMTSRGDFFNSTEKNIFYSAIEKTVNKKSTVSYQLTGHEGVQEFVFVAYNKKAKFTATVNGKAAQPVGGMEGVRSIRIGKVKKGDTIVFTLTNASGSPESFVIMNHNPQR